MAMRGPFAFFAAASRFKIDTSTAPAQSDESTNIGSKSDVRRLGDGAPAAAVDAQRAC